MAGSGKTSTFILGALKMCFGGSSKKQANAVAQETRNDEVARQNRITVGMDKINSAFDGSFTDNFYEGQKQAYRDYATPQIDRQYGDTKDSLVYALARTGLLDSSAGQKENADLSRAYDQYRVDTESKAQDLANTSRANVENARSGVVAQLNATGDDAAAADAATRTAKNLAQPQGYSALGDLFTNIAAQIATIGSNSRNDYSGLVGGGATMFAPSTGSSRVVRG